MNKYRKQSNFLAVLTSFAILSSVIVGLIIVGLMLGKQRISAQPNDSKIDLKGEMAKLQKLVIAKDLSRLMEYQKSIDKRLGERSDEIYLLKSEICKNLNAGKFDDSNNTLYARQCTKSLLKQADFFSADLEFDLLRILQELEEYRTGIVDSNIWPKDRKERIDFLHHFYRRVQREYDPHFDFNDRKNIPITRVCVPNSNYRCGIRPEEIREVTTREAYKRAIEENRIKVRRFNGQRQLHQMIGQVPNFVNRFIIGMYRQPPFEENELTRVLDRFEIYGDRRTNILSSVRE